MPIDMSKYLGLFTSEATEHLEALSQELVRLEQGGGAEVVDSMFRHAHSVKGMAASMGFEQIATLAHRVEDLAEQVRNRPAVMSPQVADVLFAATDHLLTMVQAAGAGAAAPDASELIGRIGERLLALTGVAPAPTRMAHASVVPASDAQASKAPTSGPAATPAAVPGVGGALPRFLVRIRIAASCPTPGVRAFLVHKKLGALGEIRALDPCLEDLKAGRLPGGALSLEIEPPRSTGEEALRKALSAIADLESVEVSRVEPPAPRPSEPEPSRAPDAEQARTVRVKTETLDYFLDAAGELLLATAHLRALGQQLPDTEQAPMLGGVDRLHAIVKDLHNKVMSVRMTPLSLIIDRLPRALRELARSTGREVELVISGAEIELDRAILDELADPLLHLLRNSVDHGLETPSERTEQGKDPRGRISISAHRDRDRVVVELEDDGRGMNAEALKASAIAAGRISPEAAAAMSERDALLLCCLPGISTSARVSDVSGRGVGMDAAKRAVESVGGTLEIESVPGRGTRFAMRLPLTVAVVNVLLVGLGDEVFGLPIAKVQAVVEADPAGLSRSRQTPLLCHAGELLQVWELGELLRIAPVPAGGVRPFVILEVDAGLVALKVDRLIGQQEAVLKPLSRPLDLIAGLAGVTILGSGRPIFILDAARLIAG